MIAVKVCRGGSSVTSCGVDDPLLNWGEDISEVLLSDEAVAVERGRVEIDLNHQNKKLVTGTLSKLVNAQPTTIIQMDESKGRLTSVSLSVSSVSRSTGLTMESLI